MIEFLYEYEGFDFNEEIEEDSVPKFHKENRLVLRKISGPWFIDRDRKAYHASGYYEEDIETKFALNYCYELKILEWEPDIETKCFKIMRYRLLKQLGTAQ